MSDAIVREIRRDDLARVWEMVHGLADFEKLEDILTGNVGALERALFESPPFLYGLVAEHADRLVGYALYHYTFSSFRTNPRMWLEDLFVESDARGTGAGAALLRAFARDALARGCHRIDWHVIDWNPARAFYERMGATPSTDGWTQLGMDADAMRALTGADD